MIKRGEVWWINFDPSVGGETKKQRPAVIISNDTSNKYLNRVQVIPLTSNTDRIYPNEALVNLLGQPSKAMADQLATISKERLIRQAGSVTSEELQKIEEVIKIQLGML
jgi:mRNA interferase MazF